MPDRNSRGARLALLAGMVVAGLAALGAWLVLHPRVERVVVWTPDMTRARVVSIPPIARPLGLVPELEIGGDAQLATHFRKIKSLLPLPGGRLWVIDDRSGPGSTHSTTPTVPALDARVRILDEYGAVVREVGRRGIGVGDWMAPNAVRRLPHGRVLLTDGALNRRLTFFAETGEYLGSRSLDVPIISAEPDVDGSIAVTSLLAQGGGLGSRSVARAERRLLVSNDAGERVLELVASSVRPNSVCLESDTRTQDVLGGDRVILRAAWSPRGFFAVGWASPRMAILSGPIRLAGGFSSQGRRSFCVSVGALGVRSSSSRAGDELARSVTGLLSIVSADFDYDGRLWLRAAAPEERGAGPTEPVDSLLSPTYHVLSLDGTYLGSVRLPPGVRLPGHPIAVRGDRLWAVRLGSTAGEAIVRYRIQW